MADIFDGASDRGGGSRYDQEDASDTMSLRSQDDTARYEQSPSAPLFACLFLMFFCYCLAV
jgi:hypothetical protein